MQNITHYIKYIKPGEVFLSGRHSRPLTITTLGPTSQKKKRQHNQSDHELSAIARLGDPATTRINSVQYSRPWATLTDTNVGGVGGTAFLKRGEDDQETLSWKIKKKKKKSIHETDSCQNLSPIQASSPLVDAQVDFCFEAGLNAQTPPPCSSREGSMIDRQRGRCLKDREEQEWKREEREREIRQSR